MCLFATVCGSSTSFGAEGEVMGRMEVQVEEEVGYAGFLSSFVLRNALNEPICV